MNLGATLCESVPEPSQIDSASGHLSRIQLPELQRPAVGHKQEPTLELVNWASQMYCFSLLAHFRELLRSFLDLVQDSFVPASFVVARCLFEMAAHAHYTHKHAVQYLDANGLQAAWDFLFEINMGSRYMREEYGDQPADWPPFAAPREIAKVIRCFDEWSEGKATTEYSFLSEFAHPNMAAFSHYYIMEPNEGGFAVVRFIDPPRNNSAVPWPLVSISLVACLHFALRILQRVGEKEIAPQIETILVEFEKPTE